MKPIILKNFERSLKVFDLPKNGLDSDSDSSFNINMCYYILKKTSSKGYSCG